MSKESELHLSSGLGLACRITINVLESAGTDLETIQQFRQEVLDALNRLDPEEAKRLRGIFSEGIQELTSGGRFKGRRRLEGRLTTIESHVVRDFLNVQGVDAELRKIADVTNPVFCVEVWVRPIHFEKAQLLMETLTDSRGELITCTACGEENPQGFAMCWKCNAPLMVAPEA